MTRLFISGMFRSGTTLLARMLHTHQDIVCASDPYRPFYNCLRDSIAKEIGIEVEPYEPLGSYFADDDQRRVFDAVQAVSLDRRFDRERSELLARICDHGRQFSPRIIENLDAAPGETFEDVYRNLLAKVPEHYGEGHESIEATKEVWTTEFVPALARTFPDSKFLLVLRDPRAVAASNNVEENRKYPWTFLARQWRKLATLTWLYDTDRTLAGRVKVVRYEDLVQSPREIASSLCAFLNIDFDETVLDPSTFVDGKGNQWFQNTSYDGSSLSFNTDSVDKWQRVLDTQTVALLEQCCHPEMTRFDYEFKSCTGLGIDDDLLLSPPVVRTDEMADWITPHFMGRSQTAVRSELGTEHIRHRMLQCDEQVRRRLDSETIRAYFLSERHFDTARERLHLC